MSEPFGLKWWDIDFTGQQISVLRSIVKQTVGPCKTEASQKSIPLDPHLVRTLRAWRHSARFRQSTDWVFASLATQGRLPFWGQALMNARAPALVGDPEAGAYELLFSFSTPADKDQFLDLVRSNEDMGSDYIENDFMSPTTEEIRNARPLVAVLPEDIVSRATLIASAICAGAEGDPLGS